MLDAARSAALISHQRLWAESQVADTWKRLITALLDTPLSPKQRELAVEILRGLERVEERTGRLHKSVPAGSAAALAHLVPLLREQKRVSFAGEECLWGAKKLDLQVSP